MEEDERLTALERDNDHPASEARQARKAAEVEAMTAEFAERHFAAVPEDRGRMTFHEAASLHCDRVEAGEAAAREAMNQAATGIMTEADFDELDRLEDELDEAFGLSASHDDASVDDLNESLFDDDELAL